MSTGARPLVTFALLAYNQERFVQGAVEAAFAQTYSPLEIVLSDDCSRDGTFEVMARLAREYRGPHSVVLNRTSANRGLGGHINSVVDASHGELIVVASGDDVSLPQRTLTLCDLWRSLGEPSALHSNVTLIDEHGAEILAGSRYRSDPSIVGGGGARAAQRFLGGELPMAQGCSAAYSRSVFEKFGPLPPELTSEDYALSLRAWFLDGIGRSPEKLVLYRAHGGSLTNSAHLEAEASRAPTPEALARWELRLPAHMAAHIASMYGAALADIDQAKELGLISAPERARLAASVVRKSRIALLQVSWWRLGPLERIWLFLRTVPLPFSSGDRDDAGRIRWMLPRLLGLRLFCGVKSLLRRAARS